MLLKNILLDALQEYWNEIHIKRNLLENFQKILDYSRSDNGLKNKNGFLLCIYL